MKDIKELKEKQRDLTIISMHKNGTQISTEAQGTQLLIDRFYNTLLKVQDGKRKSIELLYKIESEKK